MVPIAAALHFALISAPQLSFDGGLTCDDQARASTIVARYADSLPVDARVTMQIVPESDTGRVLVEVSVISDGETPLVERQFINSCEEALSYLDFYLSVWAPPVPEETRDDGDAQVSRRVEDSRSPPSVIVGAFGQGTTNNANGVGFGVGAGLDLTLDTVRLGAFGIWNQPSILEGDPSEANYSLQRLDVGGHLCAKALSLSVSIWPCLGVSARRFSIEENEAAPDANLDATVASADASLIVAKAITNNAALEGALAFRHAMSDVDIGRFQVGAFRPASFEVTLRIGLTWDMAGSLRTAPVRADSVAAREGEFSW
jgi:hypothetical protein